MAPRLSARKVVSAPLLGQRRNHDNRHWMAAHQLFQEGQPIHARHLDVESEHVRIQGLDLFSRDIRVAGCPNYFKLGVGTKDLREQLAHQRRVVHDQHLRSRSYCVGPLMPAERTHAEDQWDCGSAESIEKHPQKSVISSPIFLIAGAAFEISSLLVDDSWQAGTIDSVHGGFPRISVEVHVDRMVSSQPLGNKWYPLGGKKLRARTVAFRNPMGGIFITSRTLPPPNALAMNLLRSASELHQLIDEQLHCMDAASRILCRPRGSLATEYDSCRRRAARGRTYTRQRRNPAMCQARPEICSPQLHRCRG